MQRPILALVLLVLGLAGVCAAIVVVFALRLPRGTTPPAGARPPVGRPAPPSSPDTSQPAPMEFTREGIAAAILQAVERVARPGQAQVAVQPRNGGRWVCIVAAERQRYFDLDQGVTPDNLPGLKEGGFERPPQPIAQTMSIYRSVAKRAMAYDAARGDRILVLLCPREEWPRLTLRWPPAARGEPKSEP